MFQNTNQHPCQTLVFIKKPQILFLLNFRMHQASAKWLPQLDPLPLIFQSQVELRSKHLKKFQASCCLMVGGLPKTIPQQIAILKLRTLFLGAHLHPAFGRRLSPNLDTQNVLGCRMSCSPWFHGHKTGYFLFWGQTHLLHFNKHWRGI